MITLDAVRTAMLSADPYTELDRLVRNELGAGRTTEQITNDFRPILDEALETSGLSEDGKESLLSTLDALTGNCLAEQCYQDPPNNTLPSEEEIAKLPRWARVAFAARCARRVLPLFRNVGPMVPEREQVAVVTVIEFTERAAALAAALAESAEAASHAAVKATVAAGVAGAHSAQAAARSAVRAAQAIIGAVHDYALPGSDVTAIAETIQAALESTRVSDVSGSAKRILGDDVAFDNDVVVAGGIVAGGRTIEPFIRRDFDHIASLADWQHWGDDTPVPPEVFGPLWPEGPPKGWPPVTDVLQRIDLVIEAFACERATEQMIADDIVNLFDALNRYHIARSGVRLTLEQFRSLLPASVPAEV